MKTLVAHLILIFFTFSLLACGQKGPLYVPHTPKSSNHA